MWLEALDNMIQGEPHKLWFIKFWNEPNLFNVFLKFTKAIHLSLETI